MEASSNPVLKKYEKDFESILKQIENVSRITQNILRHSKKPSTTTVAFNLLTIIRQSVMIFEPLAGKLNISIKPTKAPQVQEMQALRHRKGNI